MIVTIPIKERRVASYCDTSRRCSSDRYSNQTVSCCCCPPRTSAAPSATLFVTMPQLYPAISSSPCVLWLHLIISGAALASFQTRP